MKRNNKKGFTIVELVIVIAVIAILSAVLIPTFGGITTKAQASALAQEAKNAYTNYLIDCDATPNKAAYIVVTDDNNTKHYYDIDDNGQIVLDVEANPESKSCLVETEGDLKNYVIATYNHVDNNGATEGGADGKCDVCGK